MKALLYYLAQVIVTSGILYAWYHFALRNKKFHRYNRFYLLAATVISITIPFLDIPVYFTQTETESSFVLQTLTVISSTGPEAPVLVTANATHPLNWFTWQNLTYCFYILIASIALLRIIISLIKIRWIAKNNPVEQLDNIHFVNTNEPGTPFSFFRWLFWNRKIELRSEKGEQIFRHELFHIKQKHSRDIMYMESLTVVLWINPFFHLIKKEIKAIHEFLADRFAITENTKWQYAELLLMQVLNTNQRLVNPFFHNQIKRRIAMITTSKKSSYQYLRKLMVLPVSLILLFLFAFTYKTKNDAGITPRLNESGLTDITKPENKVSIADTTIPKFDTKNVTTFLLQGNIVMKDKDGNKLYLRAATITGEGFDIKDTSQPLPAKMLFVIDGKESAGIESFIRIEAWIDPSEINSINILKGPPAIVRYGEKGKNGVIEILTKKNNAPLTESILTDSKTIDTTKPRQSDNIIFDRVEIEPSFPGGDSAWKRYLTKNANGLVPVDSGAPPGVYKVIVQFIVHEDGSLSDVKALTHHGYGMENESIRLIAKGPKWIPARQNGHIVEAYVQQPITFAITDDPDNFAIIENKTSVFAEKDKKMLILDPSVLYIGVDNYITVACSGIKNEDLVVNISQGKITGTNGKYYIKVFAVSENVVLQVSTKDGKELGRQVFKARTIPNLSY